MDPFDRLAPAVQYQVVNGLGFTSLRPVQEDAIGPVLDGKNCVLLAPTAGGKTEAAFFPLFSAMDAEDWRPVSVIYVAPLRALLNNQEGRIEQLASLLGRRVFKWHGDVTTSPRKSFIKNPADILLTTPESLEVMLMSPAVPARTLFRNLRVIVVDEVHAFAGDDRGGHLAAVLERLCRMAGRDLQRIGLSATVGNPEAILEWMRGSSQREGVVNPPREERRAAEIEIDFAGSEEGAADEIARRHAGEKRLVFIDSRRGVEALGKLLRRRGVETFVTHSSLSVGERRQAENAFTGGSSCVIVATSALELGIDIGDLDRVIQVDAPTTVASFLQRMGRTGRRDGTVPNCLFLATEPERLVQAAALVRLERSGFVEPVRVPHAAAHLVAHQLLALALQENGVPRADWWSWISGAAPFAGIDEADRADLLQHMLAEGILDDIDGRLVLGARGEKLYGWRNFSELYAVFSTPKTLTVLWGAQEIGSIDATFADQQELAALSFVLGARAWRAIDIDWKGGVVHVEPIDDSDAARWHGTGRLLHRPLCEAIRAVLTGSDEDPTWTVRARKALQEVRAEHADISAAGLELLRDATGYRLWTFAGGAGNNLLARCLESLLGPRATVHNLYIGLREEAGKSEAAIRHAVAELRATGHPEDADAVRFASDCATERLSKFEPCLPDRLKSQFHAAVLTSVDDARAAIVAARSA